MDSDGTNQTRLTNVAGYDIEPDWGPEAVSPTPTPTPTPTATATPTATPTPTWAYGIDKYSFIDEINVSPTGGAPGTNVGMTCSVTGLPYPSVELWMSNGSSNRLFAESTNNWKAYEQCYDHLPFNDPGTYQWTSLKLNSTDNFNTTYTPDGIIKDHDGNVVGTHSLSIPSVVIAAPTPTPVPIPVGQIVFRTNRTGNDEIFVIDTDGTGAFNVTHSSAAITDQSPIPSPDGNMVAYGSNQDAGSSWRQFVRSISIDASCSVDTIVVPNSSYFAWAPDSRQLVVDVSGDVVLTDICNGDSGFPSLPTTQTRNLTSELGAEHIQSLVSDRPSFDWSPDGQTIVFVDLSRSAIRGIQPNTEGSATISTLVDVTGFTAISYIDFSPSGTSLVFMGRVDTTERIYIADITSVPATPMAITDSSSLADWPSWSPSGSTVVFGSASTGHMELYTVEPDGSQLTQLTFTVGGQALGPASWSPSGSHLVYQSTELDTGDLYIIESNGANKTRITTNASRDREPQWVP